MYIKDPLIFKQYINDCISAVNQMQNNADRIFKELPQIVDCAVRVEYGIGGLNLHRGLYCPSPAFDLVVGNTSRGRVVKRIRQVTHPDFEYGFDASGRLIFVHHFYQGKHISTEVILYDDSIREGYTFSNDTGEVCCYSKEIYKDHHLVKYEQFYPFLAFPRIYHYRKELFEYTEMGLHNHEWIDFYPNTTKLNECSLNRNIHQFEHDREGYLSSYRTCTDSGDYDDYIHHISTKRKI